MRKIRVIVIKEFRQIFRNRPMLAIIFIMPVIQLLILANAASYEIRRIRFALLDHDHSTYSRQLTASFRASPQFDFTAAYPSGQAAGEALQRGDADVVLEIPRFFERDR